MTPPIIFIHNGYADYLQWNILHAKKLTDRVIVISNAYYSQCECVPFTSLGAMEFNRHYVHLSQVSKKFELFCFNRWFILLDFLKKQSIDTFIYLDSDCVLYDTQFDLHKMTLSGDPSDVNDRFTKSGHCMFSNQKTLETFCHFVLQYYQNPQKLEALKAIKKGIPVGGICDMTLLGLFAYEHPQEVILTHKPRQQACFDHNINVLDGFVGDAGRKKIVFEGAHPFGFLENGEKIKFFNLHFQGSAKQVLPQYLWIGQENCTKKPVIKQWWDHFRNR